MAYLSGVLGSYGVAIMTFIEQINVIGIITAVAGALLTMAMAYDKYMEAQFRKEEMLLKRTERQRAEQELKDEFDD